MTDFALYLPEQRGPARLLFAAAVILAVHAAIVIALIWHPRPHPEHPLAPAIAVSLAPAPVQSAAPEVHEQEDLPVGPDAQQGAMAPPKQEEQKVEQQAPPPPPAENADATLAKNEPKPIEQPTPQVQPGASETTAPPKNEHVGAFTQAASNAYNALIVGHLEKYKRYPPAARGAVGKTMLRFTLDRDGKVVDVRIEKSSGNSVLDQEALAVVHRAEPFPKFPAAKPEAQDFWVWPANFDRGTRR